MNHNDILCTLALAQLPRLGLMNAKLLLERIDGKASLLFENQKDLQDVIPDISEKATMAFVDTPFAMNQAKREMDYAQQKGINILCLHDDGYPRRLKECPDAPVVLFSLGNADLNTPKVISMVGTRKCTQYGRDICSHFIAELKASYPNILIVSGLAYGIDICSHREALENGMHTVGVLAHGLDRIYPAVHRAIAAQMVHNGGLLTEYFSRTTPEKVNFIRRNRIVAGMADATIVVESAERGGSLITADIAQSYHRDVFAFPGRIYDTYSQGCNRIIKEQKAVAIRNVDDLLDALCWPNPKEKSNASNVSDPQFSFLPDFNDNEKVIVDCLRGCDDKAINQIVVDTGISYSQISSILFDLELKGIVTMLGGARYHLNFMYN